ncbi:hypothetical protein RAS1_22420 [Phycisphaerae bacterium RAS1]|nr:hypothetical protein RAS1_22420 [Phycisphaerae bacterium RAS1]
MATAAAPRPQNSTARSRAEEQKALRDASLCATCIQARDCVYAANTDRPVLCCELFDDASQRTARARAAAPESGPARRVNWARGLCADCAAAAGCVLAASEGGVWWCEEYE